MTNPAEPKDPLGPKGPSDFVKEAYSLDDNEKRVEFYRKWADAYDQQMLDALSYTSPIDIPDASYETPRSLRVPSPTPRIDHRRRGLTATWFLR
ncbi:MAG: hypothetical protein V3R76_09860 [Gammaproteobacteria bacterium]